MLKMRCYILFTQVVLDRLGQQNPCRPIHGEAFRIETGHRCRTNGGPGVEGEGVGNKPEFERRGQFSFMSVQCTFVHPFGEVKKNNSEILSFLKRSPG